MEDTSETIVNVAKSLSSRAGTILPPLEVLRECKALARANESVRELEIGKTESGQCLNAYEFGHGQAHALFYGFPDPGEALGGTSILSLLRGLTEGDDFLTSLDVTWHFIPCLNLDDQPDGGRTLCNVFRDPDTREVDWCVANPRSETIALLDYARSTSPVFTFPLHDEYHSGVSIPVYVIVSECLAPAESERVRACLQSFGLRLRTKDPHNVMGTAFEVATDLGEEYFNSTFSRMANYGLVAVCEISQQEGIPSSALVAAQIAVGLIFLDVALKKQARSIEQGAPAD